jgi:hypothetical protein
VYTFKQFYRINEIYLFKLSTNVIRHIYMYIYNYFIIIFFCNFHVDRHYRLYITFTHQAILAFFRPNCFFPFFVFVFCLFVVIFHFDRLYITFTLQATVNGHKYSSASIFRYIFHIKPHWFFIIVKSFLNGLWSFFHQEKQKYLKIICVF